MTFALEEEVTVGELRDYLSRVGGIQQVNTTRGAVQVAADAVTFDGTTIELDEGGIERMAYYLDVPKTFASQRLTADLRDRLFRHFLSQSPDQEMLVEHDGRHLVGAYDQTDGLIPRGRVIDLIQRVMPAEGTIRRLNLSDGHFTTDVSMGALSVQARPGDITEGGLRFVSHISPRSVNIQPRVSTYFIVLDCMNGAVHHEEKGTITLRGKTVDDVIDEMERAAQTLLTDAVPHRLEQWASLVNVPVENVEGLVHRLSMENGLAPRLERAILEKVPELPEERHTVYDVVNLMTEFQHQTSRARAYENLLQLGGSAAAASEAHRCPQCQSVLHDEVSA